MATPNTAPRQPGQQRPRSIQALSSMELRGTADVQLYASAARDLSRQLAMEFEMTAHELTQRLERAGGSMGDRFAARRAARKVTRRLRRAAAHCNAAGDELMRFWRDYVTTYAPLINPQRGGKQTWTWQSK